MDNDFKQCRELGTKIMSSLRFLPKPLLTFLSDAVTNERQGLRTIVAVGRKVAYVPCICNLTNQFSIVELLRATDRKIIRFEIRMLKG